MTDYRTALSKAGLSPAAAEQKSETLERLENAAGELGFRPPLWAFYVPGRIEVLGKHTDYAGGRSLVCCVERGFCLLASRRRDHTIRFVDLARNSSAEWELSSTSPTPPLSWVVYPATVARRVARNFPSAQHGVDAVFSSDLPRAAGISSSSALVIASFFALSAANSLEHSEPFRENLSTPEDLATYLAAVENGSGFRGLSGDAGVGTFGGSEDHTAILCGKAGEISQYSFCPPKFERGLKLAEEWTFVIAASGVAAEKTGRVRDQYNRLSLAARSILEIWKRTTGSNELSLGAALQSSAGAREQIQRAIHDFPAPEFPREILAKRLEQFVMESEVIVPQAGDALANRDTDKLGKLVDLSQSSAELLLNNQIPETSFLAHSARELGAIAASAFGAGFGGSVWALVSKREGLEFIERWESRYRERFPEHPSSTFFLTAAGPSAQLL